MTKAELEASLATLDTFIQVFAVLVAIGIIGEVGFGVRHWILNRRLHIIQHAEDLDQQGEIARLNKEAGDARKDAGEAIERAGKAEENLAGANERAANAERHAAEANRIAEEERLARVKIEERFSPRRLSPEQQKRIVAKLMPFSGQQFSFSVYPEPEPMDLLRAIETILKAAGWIRIPSQIGDVEVGGAGVAYDTGIRVHVAPADLEGRRGALLALASALNDEGVATAAQTNPQLTGKTKNAINISVGRKP